MQSPRYLSWQGARDSEEVAQEELHDVSLDPPSLMGQSLDPVDLRSLVRYRLSSRLHSRYSMLLYHMYVWRAKLKRIDQVGGKQHKLDRS